MMLAATGASKDFYPYQVECGAVGIYSKGNGEYDSGIQVGDTFVEIDDSVWGCMAYSPITSLAEADMAMAFEYSLDKDYAFSTPFQKATAISQAIHMALSFT